MALGKSKKKKSGFGGKSKGEKKDNRYVNIMSILEGQENDNGDAKPYAKASNYKGRLIWQAFGGEDGDDEEDSTFFEIKTAFIGEPHEKAPDFVLQTLVVNLNNPKAAEALGE